MKKPDLFQYDLSRFNPRVVEGYQRYLAIAMKFPGMEEAILHDTPAIKLNGKTISRWRVESDGALAILCDFAGRELLLKAKPGVFFINEHYKETPGVLVHLEKVRADALEEVVERAWRSVANKKLIKQYDEAVKIVGK